MFSSEVLDHFQNPRNAGELEGATVSVEVRNPVCGDVLRLAVQAEQGRILRARFLCRGCTTAIACASKLTELLIGNSWESLTQISVETLAQSLGGLPAETMHGAHLAVDAAHALGTKLSTVGK
jgi:nitrogen fixation protein NifU and related proteins